MKKLLTLFFFIPILSFATSEVVALKNSNSKWNIYYIAPSGNKFFIYESNYKIDTNSLDGGDLFYQTRGNIFSILYTCIGTHADSCIRYINIKNNQISQPFQYPALMTEGPYYDLVGPIDNLNQLTILTFQYPTSDTYMVFPIFQSCKHPFVYKLEHLSDGPQPGSRFLSNGNLYLNMMMDAGGYLEKIIPIDYKQLFQNCQNSESSS